MFVSMRQYIDTTTTAGKAGGHGWDGNERDAHTPGGGGLPAAADRHHRGGGAAGHEEAGVTAVPVLAFVVLLGGLLLLLRRHRPEAAVARFAERTGIDTTPDSAAFIGRYLTSSRRL